MKKLIFILLLIPSLIYALDFGMDKSVISFKSSSSITDEEYDNIKQLLSSGHIYTIRVGKEADKYRINDILDSDVGIKLKIISVKRIKNIKEYRFYDNLSSELIDYLNRFDKIDILKLEKVKDKDIWKVYIMIKMKPIWMMPVI